MTALAVGFGLGFVVAAQVGPVTLLAVRSVLRGGFAVGIAMAVGVGVIDALYAAAGAGGASAVLGIEPLKVALGLAGAAVLVAIGARTLWSAFAARLGAEAEDEVLEPRAAMRTALAATASNPLTIASWAAIFAAASTAAVAESLASTALLVAGVAIGSFTWMAALAAVLSLVRRRLGARTRRIIDAASGLCLLAFGGLLALRTARES